MAKRCPSFHRLRMCRRVRRALRSMRTPATSAPGLGAPLPHLRRDWAHPCHFAPCTATCSICGIGVPLTLCAQRPRPLQRTRVQPRRCNVRLVVQHVATQCNAEVHSFIECVDREEEIFAHFSEVMQSGSDQDDRPRNQKAVLHAGDEAPPTYICPGACARTVATNRSAPARNDAHCVARGSRGRSWLVCCRGHAC